MNNVVERHDLRERRRQRRRKRRVPADRARRVELQPRVDTSQVKVMPAVRQHPQHLGVPILAQTDRTHGIIYTTTAVLRERKSRVGIDDGRIKANDGVSVAIVVVIVFSDEDYAGEDDTVVGGGGGGVVRVRVLVVARAAASGAATDVRGEEDGGEEEEEAEGDGYGVADADVTQVVGGGGMWSATGRGSGGGGGHWWEVVGIGDSICSGKGREEVESFLCEWLARGTASDGELRSEARTATIVAATNARTVYRGLGFGLAQGGKRNPAKTKAQRLKKELTLHLVLRLCSVA
ncbi:hypothetical protein U1Q18_023673 [Sarracenia purpurea var. burkii]